MGCTCENGVATTGADCTTDAASMCASCLDGYTINDDATACASTNTCTCENGVEMTGADCTTDAASMCASCDDGFTINGDDTACAVLSDSSHQGITIAVGAAGALSTLLMM